MGSINTITYNAPGLVVAYETLRETHELEIRQPSVKNNEKYANAKLREEIRLSNITFAYAVEKGNVLEGLDIIIKKGKSIGPVSYTHLDVYKRQLLSVDKETTERL